MNPVPCRVSIDELAHDQGVQEFSAKDLADAREELVDLLLAGNSFHGADLEGIIDAELDRNYAATLRSLYEHFANIGGKNGSDCCMEADKWMRRLVEAHVDTGLIEEMAEKIAADKLEDARP